MKAQIISNYLEYLKLHLVFLGKICLSRVDDDWFLIYTFLFSQDKAKYE